MVVSDQFVLCKAALMFAVTRWILSFALNLLTTSMCLFSTSSDPSTQPSSCCSTYPSSSANSMLLSDSLSLTTFGNIEHRLSESHDTCIVCLNRLRKKSRVWELSNCCHVFHKQCLERWLSYDNRLTCPLCRASLLNAASLPPAWQPEPPSWAVERILYLFGDDLFP